MFKVTKNKVVATFVWIGLCIVLHSDHINAQCTGVSVSDSLALVDFYYATNGDDWINNDGWLVEPVAEWFGIILWVDNCTVMKIQLSSNNVDGILPNLNLPNLQTLRLNTNNLYGLIPDFSNTPNQCHSIKERV